LSSGQPIRRAARFFVSSYAKEELPVATRAEKATLVEALAEQLASSPLSIVSGFTNLSVAEQQVLRAQMRESGATLRVIKNNLAARAAERAGIQGLGALLSGQSAFTFSGDDIVGAARVLRDFSLIHPTVDIRGGALNGEVLDNQRVLRLASIPGREQLNAEMVWAIGAPISNLVHTLDGLISGLVYALQERVDQLQAAAEGGA
jgi:large subunit ribosomal protein L10